MDVSLIVQTCDRYKEYWKGFFYYMEMFWDKDINCQKYFCTEHEDIFEKNWNLIKTGSGSFVENLNFILKNVESDYVFYMLEDFWPIRGFDKFLFDEITKNILENDIKAFQVSSYVPYYKLEKSNLKIKNQKILKFKTDSDWRFNFQSRFWKKEILLNNLKKPTVSEKKINSCIDVEIQSSKNLDKNIEIYFYHYFWYPLSGVSYRGSFTKLGKELNNNMLVDLHGKNIF